MGTPGPINCIPPTSMPHEYVIMLLGDEFIDLLVKETNLYGDAKQLSKSSHENINLPRKKWKHTTPGKSSLPSWELLLIWALSGKVI